jgi:hypothetical protein
MTKCVYDSNKECIETDDCDLLLVCCDECVDIDSEGYCDNKLGSHFPNFVDGLVVCCNQFKNNLA